MLCIRAVHKKRGNQTYQQYGRVQPTGPFTRSKKKKKKLEIDQVHGKENTRNS